MQFSSPVFFNLFNEAETLSLHYDVKYWLSKAELTNSAATIKHVHRFWYNSVNVPIYSNSLQHKHYIIALCSKYHPSAWIGRSWTLLLASISYVIIYQLISAAYKHSNINK